MATFKPLFSFSLWEAKSSIHIMEMLAGQAAANVRHAIAAVELEGSIEEGEYPDEAYAPDGEPIEFMHKYFSVGSCIGDDLNEVKEQYIDLITQLTRRSSFLTIFGLFEHRVIGCLALLMKLSNHKQNIKRISLEEIHNFIVKIIADEPFIDIDHLIILRNIMAHNDAVANNYRQIQSSNEKKTQKEKRMLNAVKRLLKEDAGVTISRSNHVIMDDFFLPYAVSEFKRYINSLEISIHRYHKSKRT